MVAGGSDKSLTLLVSSNFAPTATPDETNTRRAEYKVSIRTQ
jgi:hypothetical protein